MVENPKARSERLEALAVKGDAKAFGQLIRDYDSDLRGAVYNIARSSEHLDDIMQKSYEKAFKAIKGFESNSSMKTWLYSICTRTAVDHLKYEQRRNHSDVAEKPIEDKAGSVEDIALATAACNTVLSDLEPQTRALMVLTAGLGYSFTEAAEVVGIERGTAASKVSRAKSQIRDLHKLNSKDGGQ